MYFQLFNEGNGSSDSCPLLNRVLELIYSKFYRLRVNRRWKFGGQVQAVPTELRFELDKERISIVEYPVQFVGFWAPNLGTLREVEAWRGQTFDQGADLGRFDEKDRRREKRR